MFGLGSQNGQTGPKKICHDTQTGVLGNKYKCCCKQIPTPEKTNGGFSKVYSLANMFRVWN